MSGELVRIAFHFPNDSEIRYLEFVPTRGQQVFGLHGEPFVVSQVEEEGDGYLVSCLTMPQYAHEVRRKAMALRHAALRAGARAADLTQRLVEPRQRQPG
jgi:hypothetical protein